MRFVGKGLILLMSIAAGFGADKDTEVFKAGKALSYPNHQTIQGLTIAADAFKTREQTEAAFGKLDPAKYGLLPILIVMQNDSDQTLRLAGMRVEFIRPDHRSLEPIPSDEVQYMGGVTRPDQPDVAPPLPIPGLGKKKKNPLAAFEVKGRAFSAPMLPPGDSASGFFYFNTAPHRDSILYIRGIKVAATGQELFFFEIPLQ